MYATRTIMHYAGWFASFGLVVLAACQVESAGIAQVSTPASEFSQYPSEPRLAGRPAAPQMILAKARRYRTVLRLAAVEGPNFNGHYVP